MEYLVGDILLINGSRYKIIGKVQYKNLSDNCFWYEYRLIQQETGMEKWLSADLNYNEYSISEAILSSDTTGYHVVDEGTEEVVGAWGNVDVESGDRAKFIEYEDDTEEKIRSCEIWDDETEYSSGYYIDLNEIQVVANGGGGGAAAQNQYQGNTSYKPKKKFSITNVIIILSIVCVLFGSLFNSFGGLISSKSIAKHLKEDTAQYTYVTSITGSEQEHADVYSSNADLDTTVRDILNAIEGNTEDVQQNTEDGDESVAILTKNEYCLVYISEEDEHEVLVQISSRKYAYTSDRDLYRGRRYSNRYYRRFYYSRGYSSDNQSYGSDYSSAYRDFDDSTINYNSSDTYNTYSSTVRQSSVNSRNSSGGGLSSGK